MRTAIVTGANGFVGKAVVKELIHPNVKVYAIIRPNSQNIEELENLYGIKVIDCDMADYIKLPSKIKEKGIDIFYHFAWMGSSGKLRSDEKVQMKNVEYACSAVYAANELQCKKFCFASSIMEYEVSALMGLEKEPVKSMIYCTAKIAANYMCRILANSMGVEYMAGVISNIYGPGEKSPRLINTSIRKMLMGEYVSFSSGEQMYDFIYITDAAKVFVALADNGKNNKIYYIGSRKPRKLKDFLLEMRDVVSPNTEIGLGDIPFDGVSLSYNEFNINAVYNDTGISPQISFREGIKNTMEWIRNSSEED